MKAGWDAPKLEAISTFSNGLWKGKKGPLRTANVLRNTNFRPNGGLSFDDVAELEVETRQFEKRQLKRGDIILERSGGGPKQPVGRVALFDISDAGYSFSNFTSAIRLKPDSRIDPKYLHHLLNWWYLDGRTEQIQSNSTSIRNLDFNAYKAFSVMRPPLEEQQRIVAILDEAFGGLDRARANAEANLQNARELFSGTIEGLLKRAGGVPLTLSEMLERKWITGHLDGNHGSSYPRKDEFVSAGVPYISANCIDGDLIDLSRCKFLSPERADTLRKGVAQDRDVIFAHNATVGPVALLTTEEPRVLLSTSLTYYRCDERRVSPEFLVYEMRSASFKRQYEAVMEQATRNQVPITMQRTFTHIIPPLEGQLKIVEIGTEIENKTRDLERAYKQEITDLTDLRQSLLQKAFAGELT